MVMCLKCRAVHNWCPIVSTFGHILVTRILFRKSVLSAVGRCPCAEGGLACALVVGALLVVTVRVSCAGSATRVQPWSALSESDVRPFVLPEAAHSLREPEWRCAGDDPFLLIVVFSALDNFHRRDVIRRTWGSVRSVGNASVRVAFLLGTPPDGRPDAVEDAFAGDLLQKDFVDSYENLTIKSVFMLQWAHTHCSNAHFVLKADDDSFVNVVALVLFLQDIEHAHTLIAKALSGPNRERKRIQPLSAAVPSGPFMLGYKSNSPRHNDIVSKYFMPKYMYNLNMLGQILYGGAGYVISADAVSLLLKEALRTPLVPLEDFFVTGLCARRAGVQLMGHANISVYPLKVSNPCGVLMAHKVLPDVETVWSRLLAWQAEAKKTGSTCGSYLHRLLTEYENHSHVKS